LTFEGKAVHGKPLFSLLMVLLLVSPTFFLFTCQAQATLVNQDWVDLIESHCQTVDENTTAEVVVCIFPSLYGHGIKDSSGNEINDITQLGVYLFNDEELEVYDGTKKGIGKAGKDNGVLLVVALQEREYRFEVGYGLEGDITDIETNHIARDYLIPAFKNGDYGEGIYDTVVALGNEIPSANQSMPIRGYYYYENDAAYTGPQSAVPFWLIDLYGLPLWLVILLAIIGLAGVGIGGAARGGRSGGGGSSGRW
jgi:uncharacterized protein